MEVVVFIMKIWRDWRRNVLKFYSRYVWSSDVSPEIIAIGKQIKCTVRMNTITDLFGFEDWWKHSDSRFLDILEHILHITYYILYL